MSNRVNSNGNISFYFVANYLVTFGMERLEKAFSYYK